MIRAVDFTGISGSESCGLAEVTVPRVTAGSLVQNIHRVRCV